MTDYKDTLLKINNNLNILRERAARYGSDTPIALINQIADYQKATRLTKQVINGDLSDSEWREALKPLTIDQTIIEGGFFQKILHALSLPTEQQRDLRNRQIMLQRVYDFWVKDVLENSLHNEVLIELGMETRSEAVDYPWQMVLQHPNQTNRTLSPHVKMIDVFNESGGSLLILGEPGAGKTTMLLELARQTIIRAQADPTEPIPIVFNLSSWKGEDFSDWLVEELVTRYNIPKKICRPWIYEDALLLLLDGIDEVASAKRNTCVNAINAFLNEHLIPTAICSRSIDYKNLSTRLKLQDAVVLQSVTPQQVGQYLAQAGPELTIFQMALQEDPALQELAQSPLMLNIIALAYRDISVEALTSSDSLELRRKYLFDTYIQQMFAHRSTKQGYSPKRTTGWLVWLAQEMMQHSQTVFQIEELQPSWLSTRRQRWFYVLASRLIGGLVLGVVGLAVVLAVFDGLPSWLLGLGICIIVGLSMGLLDGLRFDHIDRSHPAQKPITSWILARRFLAIWLAILLTTWTCYLFLLWLLTDDWTDQLRSTNPYMLISLIVGGFVFAQFYAIPFGLIFGLREKPSPTNDIQTAEALSLSLRGALKGLISGLKIGAVAGGGIGFLMSPIIVFGPMLAPNYDEKFTIITLVLYVILSALVLGAIVGVISGLVGGLIGIVFGGLGRKIAEAKTLPNQGIRLSLKNSILGGLYLGTLCGVLAGILIGLTEGMSSGLIAGLIVGLVAAFVCGLWYGGLGVIQHFTLRFILQSTAQLPFRLVPFLNICVDHIFLRKVGGGYIFIHRYLLEYFALLTEEDIEQLTSSNSGHSHNSH